MSYLEAVLTIVSALALWCWGYWWQGRSEARDVTVDALEMDGPLGQIDARLTRGEGRVAGLPSRPRPRRRAPGEHGLIVQGILWLWRVAAAVSAVIAFGADAGGGPMWPAVVPLVLWAAAAGIALWLEAHT